MAFKWISSLAEILFALTINEHCPCLKKLNKINLSEATSYFV
jgi:hypothetical protein